MIVKNADSYKQVVKEIKKAKRIALCIHMFPDGDAIGSMVALALCLKKLKKQVWLFSPSPLPRRYSFLSEFDRIKLRAPEGVDFDLAIAVDCASKSQLGDFYPKVFKKSAVTIEIDHHTFRKRFARVSLLEKEASAVGEMIYHLAGLLNVEIDKDMAIAILVSIIVETGSFRLPSVRPETFRICADMIARGIDYYKIVEKSYWSRTKAEALLLGLCFSRIKFYKKGKLAYSYVTFNDMRRLGALQEDIDPIADQIRMLKSVKVVLLLREISAHRWRVSLRSKGTINVGLVAEEFGGGGHPDIAGCFIEKTVKEKNRLLKRLEQLL